ncbi:hypothetical protein CYMTET_7767 [Cymbomonas tetramitiformis]|uniref:Uncharacterized protein n=1 Tax=Cymbomonas tetramitiformis TaxID=36881 RepID=A0AAE0LGN5_9CHLO|nr:hypothetical protein CYMTET_7767 [Cymbomonas tetramitiformis]
MAQTRARVKIAQSGRRIGNPLSEIRMRMFMSKLSATRQRLLQERGQAWNPLWTNWEAYSPLGVGMARRLRRLPHLHAKSLSCVVLDAERLGQHVDGRQRERGEVDGRQREVGEVDGRQRELSQDLSSTLAQGPQA